MVDATAVGRQLRVALGSLRGADTLARDAIGGKVPPDAFAARLKARLPEGWARIASTVEGWLAHSRVHPATASRRARVPAAQWAQLYTIVAEAALEDARVAWFTAAEAAIDDLAAVLPAIAAGEPAAVEAAVARAARVPWQPEALAAAPWPSPHLDAALARVDAGPLPTPQEQPPLPRAAAPADAVGAARRALGVVLGAIQAASKAHSSRPPAPQAVDRAMPVPAPAATPVGELPVPPGPIIATTTAPDGRIVAIGHDDDGGWVVIGRPGAEAWDARAEDEARPVAVAAGPLGVIVAGDDGELSVYDEDLEIVGGATVGAGPITAIAFDGDYAIVGVADGSVYRVELLR